MRQSQQETAASKLVAKTSSKMSRIENSVRETAVPGFERNVYGSYFRIAAFDGVIALLDQAAVLHDLRGAAAYVRAGKLAWAGRLPQAAIEYRSVTNTCPSYAHPSLAHLAWLQGLLGNWAEASELVERFNAESAAISPLLHSISLEKLGFGKQ